MASRQSARQQILQFVRYRKRRGRVSFGEGQCVSDLSKGAKTLDDEDEVGSEDRKESGRGMEGLMKQGHFLVNKDYRLNL